MSNDKETKNSQALEKQLKTTSMFTTKKRKKKESGDDGDDDDGDGDKGNSSTSSSVFQTTVIGKNKRKSGGKSEDGIAGFFGQRSVDGNNGNIISNDQSEGRVKGDTRKEKKSRSSCIPPSERFAMKLAIPTNSTTKTTMKKSTKSTTTPKKKETPATQITASANNLFAFYKKKDA